jgi:hypothetical protein
VEGVWSKVRQDSRVRQSATCHCTSASNLQLYCLTSIPGQPSLEAVLCNGHSHQWGRHGFDGDACGQEACQGAHTCNRVQNDNCQSTNGIRSLIY